MRGAPMHEGTALLSRGVHTHVHSGGSAPGAPHRYVTLVEVLLAAVLLAVQASVTWHTMAAFAAASASLLVHERLLGGGYRVLVGVAAVWVLWCVAYGGPWSPLTLLPHALLVAAVIVGAVFPDGMRCVACRRISPVVGAVSGGVCFAAHPSALSILCLGFGSGVVCRDAPCAKGLRSALRHVVPTPQRLPGVLCLAAGVALVALDHGGAVADVCFNAAEQPVILWVFGAPWCGAARTVAYLHFLSAASLAVGIPWNLAAGVPHRPLPSHPSHLSAWCVGSIVALTAAYAFVLDPGPAGFMMLTGLLASLYVSPRRFVWLLIATTAALGMYWCASVGYASARRSSPLAEVARGGWLVSILWVTLLYRREGGVDVLHYRRAGVFLVAAAAPALLLLCAAVPPDPLMGALMALAFAALAVPRRIAAVWPALAVAVEGAALWTYAQRYLRSGTQAATPLTCFAMLLQACAVIVVGTARAPRQGGGVKGVANPVFVNPILVDYTILASAPSAVTTPHAFAIAFGLATLLMSWLLHDPPPPKHATTVLLSTVAAWCAWAAVWVRRRSAEHATPLAAPCPSPTAAIRSPLEALGIARAPGVSAFLGATAREADTSGSSDAEEGRARSRHPVKGKPKALQENALNERPPPVSPEAHPVRSPPRRMPSWQNYSADAEQQQWHVWARVPDGVGGLLHSLTLVLLLYIASAASGYPGSYAPMCALTLLATVGWALGGRSQGLGQILLSCVAITAVGAVMCLYITQPGTQLSYVASWAGLVVYDAFRLPRPGQGAAQGQLSFLLQWQAVAVVVSYTAARHLPSPPRGTWMAALVASGVVTNVVLVTAALHGHAVDDPSLGAYYILAMATAVPRAGALAARACGDDEAPTAVRFADLFLFTSATLVVPLTILGGAVWWGRIRGGETVHYFPAAAVLCCGVAERWLWREVVRPHSCSPPAAAPDKLRNRLRVLSSVLYDLLITALAVCLFVVSSHLAVASFVLLLYLCRTGKTRLATRTRHTSVLVGYAVGVGGLVYFSTAPRFSSGDLVAHWIVTLLSSALLGINRCVAATRGDEALFPGGMTGVLWAQREAIAKIVAKGQPVGHLEAVLFPTPSADSADAKPGSSHHARPSAAEGYATFDAGAEAAPMPTQGPPPLIPPGTEAASTLLGMRRCQSVTSSLLEDPRSSRAREATWYSAAAAVPAMLVFLVYLDGAVDGVGLLHPGTPLPPAGNASDYQWGSGLSGLGLTFTLPVSKVLRVAMATYFLPSLHRLVWFGAHAWRWLYRFYVGLFVTWCAFILVPRLEHVFTPDSTAVSAGAVPTPPDLTPALLGFPVLSFVVMALLWKFGRLMDTAFWGRVLLYKYTLVLAARREGARIVLAKKHFIEEAHLTSMRHRHARIAALTELQRRKADFNKAWRALLKQTGAKVQTTPLAIPPVFSSFKIGSAESPCVPSQRPESLGAVLPSPQIPNPSPPPRAVPGTPDDFYTQRDSAHPTDDVPPAPSALGKALAYLLSFSYAPLDAAGTQQMIHDYGRWGAVRRVAGTTALSSGAEVVCSVTLLHFLQIPCVATLLPALTIVLHALCSSPTAGYWQGMIKYYQIVVVAKALLLGFGVQKGSLVTSNWYVLLLFGWKTMLLAQHNMLTMLNFSVWELALLALLILHRHALVYRWGLWEHHHAPRHDRLLPTTNNATLDDGVFVASRGPPPDPKHTARIGIWGGVHYSKGTVLGGAAAQAAAQGVSHGIPYGLSRVWRRVWRDLVNSTVKTGSYDLYVPGFVADLAAFFVLLVGFSSIMGMNEGIADSIRNNILPGALVLALFVLFLLIVAERVVYLTRSLYAKIVLHVLLSLAAMLWYLVWCYFHVQKLGGVGSAAWVKDEAARWEAVTVLRPTWILQLFMSLKLVSLTLSALQIRYGFPDLIEGRFFAGRYSHPWYYLYSFYRAVPFLFEFKSVLDWTFTPTSLKLPYWFRLEDVMHELHVVLCDREDTRVLEGSAGGPGQPYPLALKCRSGAAIIATLTIMLFFPLVWYSSIGPALREDFVADARMTVALNAQGVTFATLYASTYQIPDFDNTMQVLNAQGVRLSLPFEWVNAIEKTRQSLSGLGLSRSGTRTVQVMTFLNHSTGTWAEGGLAARFVEEALFDAGAPVSAVLSVSLRRPATPVEKQWMSAIQMRTFSRGELQCVLDALRGETGSCTIPLSFTPFVFNRESGVAFYDGLPGTSNKVTSTLTLFNDTSSPTQAQQYWTMDWGTLFTNGNPPAQVNGTGLNGFPLSPAEEACFEAPVFEEIEACALVAYDVDASPPNTKVKTGPYLLAISDRVASRSMSVIPSLGVIALYTTFVLAAGRVLRATFTGDASKLHMLDIDQPEELQRLASYIQMARVEGDLDLEHGLYQELVYLLRNPEALRQWVDSQQTHLRGAQATASTYNT